MKGSGDFPVAFVQPLLFYCSFSNEDESSVETLTTHEARYSRLITKQTAHLRDDR